MSTSLRSNSFSLSLMACLALSALACSTTDSRIKADQELFDRYSTEDQAAIRAGQVEVGFTEDMVRMTLGKPNETTIEIDEHGEILVWAWTKSRPGISVGVGGGSGGYGYGGVGGGVGVGTPARKDLRALVEFVDGRVTSVRYFTQ